MARWDTIANAREPACEFDCLHAPRCTSMKHKTHKQTGAPRCPVGESEGLNAALVHWVVILLLGGIIHWGEASLAQDIEQEDVRENT